jgi:hypothetical protein
MDIILRLRREKKGGNQDWKSERDDDELLYYDSDNVLKTSTF